MLAIKFYYEKMREDESYKQYLHYKVKTLMKQDNLHFILTLFPMCYNQKNWE